MELFDEGERDCHCESGNASAGYSKRKGTYTGELIWDIVIQLLSYVAQTEREFIRQRLAEGIAAAKAREVHFGRRPMKRPPEFMTIYGRWHNGELSARKAATILKISHRTFLKLTKEEP